MISEAETVAAQATQNAKETSPQYRKKLNYILMTNTDQLGTVWLVEISKRLYHTKQKLFFSFIVVKMQFFCTKQHRRVCLVIESEAVEFSC